MENPPLWVWAFVVGLIIAGKYAYRWRTTKQLAKEMEQNEKVIDSKKSMTENATNVIPLTLVLQYHANIVITNTVLVPIGIILK